MTYLLHDSFPMFGSLLEIAYKFIRFNTACSLWHPCLMLLKVLIFFLSSFPNKTMFSFDLLIMIHTVESDLFFYLFHNGMSDIDAIISFKWFLVCSLCNRIYIYRRVDHGWHTLKSSDGNLHHTQIKGWTYSESTMLFTFYTPIWGEKYVGNVIDTCIEFILKSTLWYYLHGATYCINVVKLKTSEWS